MRFLFAVIAALLTTGCSGDEDIKAAQQAVTQFHAQLNAGQFDRIQDAAAPQWKQVSSAEQTAELFHGVRTKLGAFQSGKQTGWNVNYNTGGTTIVLQYASRFQKGEAQETFTLHRAGRRFQLVGYNINSRALITG